MWKPLRRARARVSAVTFGKASQTKTTHKRKKQTLPADSSKKNNKKQQTTNKEHLCHSSIVATAFFAGAGNSE